jgi:hypothetical protein
MANIQRDHYPDNILERLRELEARVKELEKRVNQLQQS